MFHFSSLSLSCLSDTSCCLTESPLLASTPLSLNVHLPPSLCVRPWWRRRWFTPSKWSRVSSCRRPSKACLLPHLLPKPPPTPDVPGSPWPSQWDLPRFSPRPWRDRPWCLALPPSMTAWGAVRDGGSAAVAGRDGASPRRGWEEGCRSRRSGRRHRCSLLCLVSEAQTSWWKHTKYFSACLTVCVCVCVSVCVCVAKFHSPQILEFHS